MDDEASVCIGVPLHSMKSAPVLTITDLQSSIGTVRKTPPFKIDVLDNAKFCDATYLSAAYPDVANSPYENDLVEGFYLVSLMDALKNCTYHDHPDYFGLNYGSDKLRFIEKIHVSDILLFECTVVSVRPKSDGFLVEVSCELLIKGGARPAVVYSLIYFLLPSRDTNSPGAS